MPLFTAENARANALKSAQVRREKRERLKNPPPPPLTVPQMPDEQARNARVMKQLDKVDEFLEQCKDPDEFVRLTAAKERLWNLVFPKAGVMHPRRSSNRWTLPEIVPIPVDPASDYSPPPIEPQSVGPEPVVQDAPAKTNEIAATGVSATVPPVAPKPPPEPRRSAPVGPPPGMECLGPDWRNHIIH